MMDTMPLVILQEDRKIIDCCLINEKGFKKSIENNSLWIVHSETGRVLPYSDNAEFICLEEKSSWVEVVVSDQFILNKSENCGKAVENVEAVNMVENNFLKDKVGTVLHELEWVIKKRHMEMPKGSYTTHLFNSGAEKIRKKTGEEAIELILASQKNEIIYEAADLVYHLMVLLESEGISISEILSELEGRK